jgi:hypothetical protein
MEHIFDYKKIGKRKKREKEGRKREKKMSEDLFLLDAWDGHFSKNFSILIL